MAELEWALENGEGSLSWGWVEHIARKTFSPESRWSRVLPGQPFVTPSDTAAAEVPLGELVRVKRGIATGANHFFVLTTDEVRAARIPRSVLRAALGRSRLATGKRVTRENVRHWSLLTPNSHYRLVISGVAASRSR